MDFPTLYALLSAPGQVKEVGEFASAVLQRNIAVGAIVLLVCGVVGLVLWLRSVYKKVGDLQDDRVSDGKTHGDQLKGLADGHTSATAKLVDDHNKAMTAKSETVARDYDAQRERFIELIVKVTTLTETVRGSVDKNTEEMRELRRTIERGAST